MEFKTGELLFAAVSILFASLPDEGRIVLYENPEQTYSPFFFHGRLVIASATRKLLTIFLNTPKVRRYFTS